VTQKRKRSDDEGESEVGGENNAEGESEVGGESDAEGESEVEDDDEKDGDYMGDGKKRTAKVCLFLYTHPTALF
jgi:hypothetical protein